MHPWSTPIETKPLSVQPTNAVAASEIVSNKQEQMVKENLEPSDKMGEAQLDGPIYEEVDKQIPEQTLPRAEEPIHDYQSIGPDERVPTPGTAD